LKKTKPDRKILETLGKGFSDEETFHKFLKKNSDYVLGLLVREKGFDGRLFVCDSTFLLCTVRYAIGRKTYIVSRVVDWILDEWDRLDEMDRTKIVNEIISFEKSFGNLGNVWEKEKWYLIVNRSIYGFLNETL
jgi:hypothetical protein